MAKWQIEDTRKVKVFENANPGDLVVDEDGDIYMIICDDDEGYTLVDLNMGDFGVGSSYDTVEKLLHEYDRISCKITEVIPSEKVVVRIS
jgi:hypothetical protein